MSLKLSPTGLGSGIDKERKDYTVYSGGWDIGRIYETRGGPEHLRWFWSFASLAPGFDRRSLANDPDALAGVLGQPERPHPCKGTSPSPRTSCRNRGSA